MKYTFLILTASIMLIELASATCNTSGTDHQTGKTKIKEIRTDFDGEVEVKINSNVMNPLVLILKMPTLNPEGTKYMLSSALTSLTTKQDVHIYYNPTSLVIQCIYHYSD